jgi:hypothetical protein
MPDGDLLSITFGTTCTPATGSSTTAPVKFSTAQAPSFGNTSGLDVAGTATDGAVTIESPGPSTGPEVRIGTDTVSAGQDAVIPVTYTANGNAIIRTEFWIDYDESCLSFDPTDSDGNSVPDDVSFNLPITFNGTVNFDESSTGSELHVIVSKATTPYPGPSQELPNGNLLSITFGTTCTPATGSSTTAPVKFSMSPTPSFTNTSGNNVTGTTIDGTVTINGPASLANLVLPHETGDQGTTVDIPMSVSNIDGLLGALITVSFDSTVLQAQEASVGSLASACSIADNTSTAGQITLSLACASALSGDGTLALLTFNVVGSPGSSTPLSFSSVSLNDGAMSASTTNGSFQINEVYSITGQVEYWNAGTAVEGTLLALSGNQTESTQSNQAGAYSFTLAPGNYTVTPEKTDDIDGISAYDASLVLQHTVHSITLTGYAAQAADVNKTNTITPMDAVYILQKSVDLITLPFPGASVIWEFDPAERSYLPLSSDHTNQDFTAILLGDVSGNWNGSALMDQPDTSTPSSGSALLVLEQGPNDAQRTTTATVTTTVKWQTEDRELYGLDLVVGYDSSQVTGIELESLASNVSFDYNISEPGTVRIGVASEQPIVGDTDLIAIQFQQAEGNDLNLNGSAQVNEQPAAVDVTIIPAPSDGRVYLPFIRQ